MRYFICALDGICLGIPAEKTERIIPVIREQTAVYETEGGEAYVSLPALFRLKDTATPHGVALKQTAEGGAAKTVLLTPPIDIDVEIPDDEIQNLPDVFGGLFGCFTGAYFIKETVILLLNTDTLIETLNRWKK